MSAVLCPDCPSWTRLCPTCGTHWMDAPVSNPPPLLARIDDWPGVNRRKRGGKA